MRIRINPNTIFPVLALPLLAMAACSSSSSTTGSGGKGGAGKGGAGTGGASTGTGGASTGTGGAGTATGGAGGAGAKPFVFFVKQAQGTNTAALASGSITVSNTFAASGNAFKYVAPNYYGTASNGFISFPTPLTGDFSITADVNVTVQNKANNACGIGLGATTGFDPSDAYAYVLMRNANNAAAGYYVSGSGAISAGAPAVAFTNNTPLQLSFVRSGTNVTLGAGPVGGALTTNVVATSALTNGTTAYGSGPLYPALSFNNVNATIAKLVIKDGAGKVLFDSATGDLVNYVPAALSLSSSTVSMVKGATASVTATAVAIGGAVSGVTAQSADPTIATVTVANGTTNSTLTVSGLKGGVTTVTVTNTGDTNAVTNTKVLTVSVDDYPATDNYGTKALVAYPASGATSAYTDGELSLTFDAAPTLNKGGSIKIFKLSDGTEVDSVAFAGETQTFGTTVLNVGTQLVRVDGSTVYFTPHLGKLAYGTDYYVVIPTTSLTGMLNGVAFNGFSNLSTVATWKFTTRAAPTLDAANVTVDGATTSTADFRTLGGALTAVGTGLATAANVTIKVAAGTYRELLRYTGPGNTSQAVTIVGPVGNKQGDTCIIQYANGNMANGSTQTRALFYFTGANLVLQNITLKNTAVRAELAQAEAIYFAGGGTLAAYNSSFYSNQDTIQTTGRNWFYKCFIEGNVDFIWGTAQAALFEDCTLHMINDLAGGAQNASLVVARTGTTIAAGANGTIGKGYVLLNSTVSVDANVTATFGRDAGAGMYYDQVALINVAFSGAGTIGAGIWNVSTAPLSLGDSSYVGWKATGCSGLNLSTLTTATGTSTTIAEQATEYDNRDHILNRVVTVTSGAPAGYEATPMPWDLSSLATAWSAP
jgi:hypothetical protein